MIQIDQVSKRFELPGTAKPFRRAPKQLVQAVRSVNLHAPNGRITGLLGPNGAGNPGRRWLAWAFWVMRMVCTRASPHGKT